MSTPQRQPDYTEAAATTRDFRPDGADPAHSDAALAERCRAGDPSAWSELVRRYQRLVFAVVRQIGLDEHAAADVFQTVFARLVEHLPRIADPGRLQAWIVTTAKREALLQRQRARRTVSLVGHTPDGDGDGADAVEWDIADETPTAEDALQALQEADRVRAALERLEPRQRDLMLLLFRDDDRKIPYEEIAARLGIPVGSIGPTRARCLEKLRRML